MKNEIVEKLISIVNSEIGSEKELINEIRKIVEHADFHKNLEYQSVEIGALLQDKLAPLLKGEKNENLLQSGFTDLDKKLGGFGQGELIVFGGRPGMGKTALLINLLLKFAEKHPVLYFTFDLSPDLLANRILSNLASVQTSMIQQHRLNDEQKVELVQAVNVSKKLKIHVVDGMNSSISLFKAYCEKEVAAKGIKVILIDYLQLMKTHRFKNNRDLEISEITRELKNIARDLNVCVIVTSQISRAVEVRGGDKRPYLSDLRESGAIEQDADKVIFIYRSEYYGLSEDENGMPTDGIMELIIAKNRTGGLDTALVGFKAENSIIYDVKQREDYNFNFSEDRLDEIGDVPF